MPSNRADRRLQAALDRLTPTLRKSVSAALARLQKRISVERLAAAIEARDEFALRAMVSGLSKDLVPALDTVRQAFIQGATTGAKGVSIQFNASNPLATAAAERTAAAMVTQVTRQTRDAIRAVITRSFREGLTPRAAAKLIRPLIGLTERQSTAVLNRRAKQQAAGWTAERIEKDAARYTQALLRQRAEMIARTEVIRASTDGKIAAWQQAQARGELGADLRKTWIVTPDDKLCPICAPLDGKQAPVAGTFATDVGDVQGPPAHPNCRCAVGLTSATAAAPRRRVA